MNLTSIKYQFIIIGVVSVILITLAIVLPLTLTRKKEIFVERKCPDGTNQPRVDCLGDLANDQHSESTCTSRGCCWSPNSYPAPSCVFPYNYGYSNTKWKSRSFSHQWADLLKFNTRNSFSNADITNLEAKIEYQTDERLHLKIYPRRNFRNKVQRWEIPSSVEREIIYEPLYDVQVSEVPFSVKIIRKNTSQVIFDTTQSSLIFSDQFLQLTTILSSANLYGIGENSKLTLKHDMNYKSWTLFASQNHPSNSINNNNLNLYSQFPVYVNIEPDGNCHLVAFYNSNPTEFYLTPFPSLTYRSLGGIFDIYIFMGPTPIQAIEQFQQAFGLPKLQPYWSFGLQIGSNNYGSLQKLDNFVQNFTNSKLPFDSVFIGTEYMQNSSMFSLNPSFNGINNFFNTMRSQSRSVLFTFIPGIVNKSSHYPYKIGTPNNKVWIYENFFSTPFIGKLLGQEVVYPDFTLEETQTWWKDALYRYLDKDEVIKFDGLFFDYLSPFNENPSHVCQNNKWNSPNYKPITVSGDLYNGTLCMDSRHSKTKHFNVHGLYSHHVLYYTSKALDPIIVNRSFIISRHTFIGTGQYSAKYLGDFDSNWDNFKRFLVAQIEMGIFGFPMSGSDICGNYSTNLDMDLCETWIKIAGLTPFMRLSVNNLSSNEFLNTRLFQVLNATLHLRYSLVPFFYTQMYHATMKGTLAIRPLIFEFPRDLNTQDINNQYLWGNKLMVTAKTRADSNTRVYLPPGLWYDYYTGRKNADFNENGMYTDVPSNFNTTALHIRGGSVIIRQESKLTLSQSRLGFVDIIIALDANFSASGDFYVDDGFRRSSPYKHNYHRLTDFKVYRKMDDGIVQIERRRGTFNTNLAYRDLIIYGLNSKPDRITVNENSYPIDTSKTNWDEVYRVYRVNLQTEVLRKVLVDNEYLSIRWSGGYKFDEKAKKTTKTMISIKKN